MEQPAKSNEALSQVKAKVDEAVQLEKRIGKLDDAIRFLGAEIGFLDIRVNYNNDYEVRFAELLSAKETHDVFSKALQTAVIDYRNKLVIKFNSLKF